MSRPSSPSASPYSSPTRSGSFRRSTAASPNGTNSPKRTGSRGSSLDPPALSSPSSHSHSHSHSQVGTSDESEVMPGVKLLLLGDSGVGKSSLMMRFADDVFVTNMISTAGVDFKIKVVRLETGQKVRLKIWDTAGQERFKTITRQYYRGAMGIVLVYDVTDENSFQHVRYWMSNIQQYASKDVVQVLVANKIDMDTNVHRVTLERGRALASEYGIPLVETSAKLGERVEEVFMTMASLVMAKIDCFTPTQSVPLETKTNKGLFTCCN